MTENIKMVRRYEFQPCTDITVQELALMISLGRSGLQRYCWFDATEDPEEYFERLSGITGLGRHFVSTIEVADSDEVWG